MKKQENKSLTGLWDKITIGYTMIVAAFFFTYVLLLCLGSDAVFEPALALADMLFLLLGMVGFVLLRFVAVKRRWRYLLITAILFNFLLIFVGGLLLLASAP